MLEVIWSLFAFIIAISVLITFHEFGHFWVARRLGVKVLRFSVGFGKPLWSYTNKHGTEFVIALFPLGGYVKMLDEDEGPVAEEELPHAFNRKSVWARIAVVCAGPVFNIIFAIFAYWLMFVIGLQTFAPIIGHVRPNSIAAQAGLKSGDEILAIDGAETFNWQAVNLALLAHLGDQDKANVLVKDNETGFNETRILNLANWQIDTKKPKPIKSIGVTPYFPKIPAVIDRVITDTPAQRAGLQSGDRITAVNNHAIANWQQLVKVIQDYGDKSTTMTVLRNGQTHKVTITPEIKSIQEGKKVVALGITSQSVELPDNLMRTERFGPITAMGHALHRTWTMSKMTIGLLVKLVIGKVSVKTISGPVGIAQGAGLTASLGISYYLSFLALISISLGILNILPIPILDGGHLMYYMVELFRGKPVSLQARIIGMKLGFILLMCLMVLAFYNDFLRIFT